MANQRARARRPNEIRSEFAAVLDQEIHRKVRQELDRARECEVQAVDGQESFHVRSVKLRDAPYSVAYDASVDRFKCDCLLVEHGGIPCWHVTAVHRFAEKQMDNRHIHPRWITSPQSSDLDQLRIDDGTAEVDSQDIEQISEEEESQVTDDDLAQIEDERLLDEGQNSIPEALGYGIDDAIERLDDMSQHNVYLSLLHFAKSICSSGAQDLSLARRTMFSFRQIRDGIYAGSNQPSSVTELHTAIGRPKGRPRKSQMARRLAAGLSMRWNSCPLCDGEHVLNECPHLPELSDVRLENSQREIGDRRKRCRICFGLGHNAQTCPHRRRPIL
jgi:hypothetical protein